MIEFTFDSYNQSEVPSFYLANPDGTELYSLGTIYDRKMELRYNTLSSFSFTAPKTIDGEDVDYYDYIEYRRLVYASGMAVFMITDVTIDNDGVVETKKVNCKSLECIFSYKKLSVFKGTYTFDNVLTRSYASGSTIIVASSENLMDYLFGDDTFVPGWTLDKSHITDEYTEVHEGTIGDLVGLKNKTRTFDITDKTLYDFLVNDVSQSYQCVFVFDSWNKTVTPYPIEDATTSTDIFISFDNLMKSVNIKESSEELITEMTVLGGDGIDISYVNPIGTKKIYNFDYYKNTNWMQQSLIDAIDTWEEKIEELISPYTNLLLSLTEANNELSVLELELSTLENQLAALIETKLALEQAGESTTEKDAEILAKQGEIDNKEAEVEEKELEISNIYNQLQFLSGDELSFENNFTSEQLSTLNNFIIGNTYTNVNISRLSGMSSAEVLEKARDLYNEGILVLEKVSQPRYNFDIDVANFVFLKEYQPFIDQLSMGCTVSIEISPELSLIEAVVLGIDFNYDNPSDFKLLLSNRMRLGDEEFQYNDLFGDVIDAGITTNFNSQRWNAVADAYSGEEGEELSAVTCVGTTIENNVPVFYDTQGTLKDVGMAYIPPTSFTPYFSEASADFTYATQVGYYSKIGNMIFFELYIAISGSLNSTETGVSIVMPIAHKYVVDLTTSFPVFYGGITLATTVKEIRGVMDEASNLIYLRKTGSNFTSACPILATDIRSTGSICISGHYFC